MQLLFLSCRTERNSKKLRKPTPTCDLDAAGSSTTNSMFPHLRGNFTVRCSADVGAQRPFRYLSRQRNYSCIVPANTDAMITLTVKIFLIFSSIISSSLAISALFFLYERDSVTGILIHFIVGGNKLKSRYNTID